MTSTSDKAKRSTVAIGSLEVEGFQMSNGTYRMGQTQAAECMGKPEIKARHFLDTRGIKALYHFCMKRHIIQEPEKLAAKDL
jgi:hypothetical protein